MKLEVVDGVSVAVHVVLGVVAVVASDAEFVLGISVVVSGLVVVRVGF